MNVLTTKEIECTCLQSNCNNTYLVKFLRPIPQIRQCTMYYLLFLKKNQNVYRQIDTQDLIFAAANILYKYKYIVILYLN